MRLVERGSWEKGAGEIRQGKRPNSCAHAIVGDLYSRWQKTTIGIAVVAVACPVLLLAHCSCPFFSSLTAYEVNWCALLAVFEQTGVSFWNCWSEAGSFYRILFGFIMAPLCKPLAPHCVSSHCRSVFFSLPVIFLFVFCLQDKAAWESLLWWTRCSSLKSAVSLCWLQPRRRFPKQWKSSPSVTVQLTTTGLCPSAFSLLVCVTAVCCCAGSQCSYVLLFADIEEKGVRMKLTVIDTPGFGDQINNENW